MAPSFFSNGLQSTCWRVEGVMCAWCSGPSSEVGEPYTKAARGVCRLGDLGFLHPTLGSKLQPLELVLGAVQPQKVSGSKL